MLMRTSATLMRSSPASADFRDAPGAVHRKEGEKKMVIFTKSEILMRMVSSKGRY